MNSRRDFLLQLGGGALAAGLPGRVGAREGYSAPVGFAVVGLGGMAQSQILPDFARCRWASLRALVSGTPPKAASLAARYGVAAHDIYSYAAFERIADDPAIKAVYIALPNALHAEYAERALNAGKHVLLEKPMTASVADAEHLVRLAQQRGKLLMVANRLQFEPLNRAMRNLTRRQAFGRPQVLHFDALTQIGPGPQWRFDAGLAGGGVLVDTGVYPVNTARTLLGEEPMAVQGIVPAPSGDARFAQVEEVCTFSMHFPSGAVAVCSTSYNTPSVSRYRISCSEGWYGLDPAMMYVGLHAEASDPARLGDLPPAAEHQACLVMDHFAECIATGRTPRSSGEDGLRDMRLMRQIYAAAGLERLA